MTDWLSGNRSGNNSKMLEFALSFALIELLEGTFLATEYTDDADEPCCLPSMLHLVQ